MSDQTTTKHTATRWLAYTGAPVMTCLPGLHPDNIDLIVDLSTLTVAASVIPALREHGTPVGTWSNVTIDKSRGVIADLALLQAPPESEGLAMFDAARELRMSIDRGIPWQASIGAKPDPNSGSYDPVLTPTLINGRTQTPNADGTPMFVLRRGVLIEISIVLWGADAQTHQLPTALTANTERLIQAMACMRDSTGRPLRGFAALHAARRFIASPPRSTAAKPTTLVEAMLRATDHTGRPMRGFDALRAARAMYPNLG
jgi:hypothetical protein